MLFDKKGPHYYECMQIDVPSPFVIQQQVTRAKATHKSDGRPRKWNPENVKHATNSGQIQKKSRKLYIYFLNYFQK